MINDILFALWFFLPAGVANVTPILAVQVPVLRNWTTPLDFGRSWRGKRLFGDHKTWRGIVSGVIVGTLFCGLQGYLFDQYAWVQSISGPVNYDSAMVLMLGFLLSVGALGGDAIKSLLKRQYSVKAGESWFPFDQLDYIIGGLLLSSLVVTLPWQIYTWIIILWFGLHLLFSYLGYLTNFKDRPV